MQDRPSDRMCQGKSRRPGSTEDDPWNGSILKDMPLTGGSRQHWRIPARQEGEIVIGEVRYVDAR